MPKVLSADPTPNEHAMKFTVAAKSDKPATYKAETAASHPVAAAVFALGGIASIFMVNDFVTVTKSPGGSWLELEPRVRAAIEGA